MIKESLEKKGFEYLDTILNDPEDLYPIYSEYKDMYENHEKYLNEFKKEYDFNADDTDKALETLQKALDDFPNRITEENRSQLLPVIAAYGAIFVAKGGRWTWNENSKKIYDSVSPQRLKRRPYYHTSFRNLWRHPGKSETQHL